MQRIMLGLVLLLPVMAHAQERTETITSTIDHVTVFQRGAQVTRTATVALPAGRTQLVFTDLTTTLDPSSIQLDGDGAFTLLSVVHRTRTLDVPLPEAEAEALLVRRDMLQDSLDYVQMLGTVYAEEESLLGENKTLGGTDGLEVAQLRDAATYFRERMTDLKTKQLALRRTRRDLEAQINIVEQQLAELRSDAEQEAIGEVVATVTAASATRSTFTLRYVVPDAGWFAAYDVRVDDVAAPLRLAYKANVQQTTGKDWENVRLTLSTGDPAYSASKPTLRPWRLGFNQRLNNARLPGVFPGPPSISPRSLQGRVQDASTGEPLPGANVVIRGSSVGTVADVDGNYRILQLPTDVEPLVVMVSFIGFESIQAPITSQRMDFELPESNVELAEIVVAYESPLAGISRPSRQRRRSEPRSLPIPVLQTDNITTTEFAIAVPYTIPSDGKPYAVNIEEYDLPADYAYYTAPKLDRSAFLTAHMTDWGGYHLLSGEANLFFGGTYVGQSYLNTDSVDDTLVVSLGRDESVAISRTKEDDFSERQRLGSRTVETVAFALEVRNNKTVPINIVVEDQVPLSTNERIDVDVEPGDDTTYDEETGLLRWRLTLPPNTTETVRFQYRVRYPSGSRVLLE